MLISFSVENFLSFKEEATLSLVASNGKEMHDSHVFTPELKNGVKSIDLLHSAVIYGPNASGKSNILESFAGMARMVSETTKEGEKLPIVPFILNKKTEKSPSVFEVVMIIDGVRYQYGFSATKDIIHDEWLLAFPKGRTQIWFERIYNKKTKKHDYTLGDALKGRKEVWRESTRTNALFLHTSVQLNSEQLQPIYDWFAEKVWCISAMNLSLKHSLDYCNEHGSDNIISFLKAADLAIEGIEINKADGGSDVKMLHKSEDNELINIPLNWESDGTKRMLSLAEPFLKILKNGEILAVDELNQRLHPRLMRYLIELFNNPQTNPNNAQLIFTTHAVSLLKNDIFRRDQIWFCERGKNQSSTLFPLNDFKPRKGHEDFEAYYMGGRYGALPFIGNFSEAITKGKEK